MSYELAVVFPVGAANDVNFANARARLLDRTFAAITGLPGMATGGWIASGFSKMGVNGNWGFVYSNYPDNTEVFVQCDDGSGNILSVATVNPRELNAALLGSRSYSITLHDITTGLPITSGIVILKNALGVTIDRKSVDATGTALFALDDGNYLVSAIAAGAYNSIVDQALTVAGNGNTTILMTAIAATAPPAGICNIVGALVDGSNTPIVNSPVSAKPSPVPQFSGTSSILEDIDVTALSGAGGNFVLPLIQGATYLLRIPTWGISHKVTIPLLPNTTVPYLISQIGS